MKYTYEFRWYANDDWKRPHKTQLFDTRNTESLTKPKRRIRPASAEGRQPPHR